MRDILNTYDPQEVLILLCRPYLARSDNRWIRPKAHPSAGAPEDWFSDVALAGTGLQGISFDFFINWSTGALSPSFWIKRIVKQDFQPWPAADSALWQRLLEQCDGTAYVQRLSAFAHRCGASLTCQLFKDSYHWVDQMPLVSARLDADGSVSQAQIKTVSALKVEIRALSGGPVQIGSKGLIYSTSTLESYLSHTDALWPGDADLILVDAQGSPAALLEFKKHTLETPMSAQRLSNYYPRPDGRKYDRLAILREFLSPDLPFVVVYYPTRPSLHSVVLERVEGPAGALESGERMEVPLPKSPGDSAGIVGQLLSFLGI